VNRSWESLIQTELSNHPQEEQSAPGKVILCGEHSAVYGRPAIALPVSGLRAHARIRPGHPGAGLRLIAADLGEEKNLRESAQDNPLAMAARLTLKHLEQPEPDAVMIINSDLPIAAGLGSGAAISVAIIRALIAYCGAQLSTTEISDLAFEVEKLHHATPSGLDNTVIAWERPIYFHKGHAPEIFNLNTPLNLIIANCGVTSLTREAVLGVRRRWEKAPADYETLFNRIGEIAPAVRNAIETGDLPTLGALLNTNHSLLQKIGVSSPELDSLVATAQTAGALGAKLTGGGMGGNIIALVRPETIPAIRQALEEAGATQVWSTTVS